MGYDNDRAGDWEQADQKDGIEDVEKSGPEEHVTYEGTPEALALLVGAVAEASVDFDDVTRDVEGQIGHQRFKYATLGMLRKATRVALGKRGVAVFQPITRYGTARPRVTTIIAGHGARIVWRLDFPRPKDVKEFGKISTYVRRYSYQAAFVLDGDEDADNDPQRFVDQPKGQTRGKPPAPPQNSRPQQQAPRGQAPRETQPRSQERPKTTPPAAPEVDPRQTTIDDAVERAQGTQADLADLKKELGLKTGDEVAKERQATAEELGRPLTAAEAERVTAPPQEAAETFVEPEADSSVPISEETHGAIIKLALGLKLNKVTASEECRRATHLEPVDVIGRGAWGEGVGSEYHAQRYLRHLQELAIQRGVHVS